MLNVSKYLLEAKLDTTSKKALYIQIAETITHLITSHTLPVGTKLPPERELAKIFGVSRTTAINAYHLLEQRQLTKTKLGSGTFVASAPKKSTASPTIPWSHLFVSQSRNHMSSILRDIVSTPISNEYISLAAGMPDPKLYPLDTFNKLFTKITSTNNPNDFGYISTVGYEPLRHTLADMLNHHGIPSSPQNLLVLSGSQQGLYLISKTLLERGDYVVLESPTYIGAIQIFQSLGARVLTIPASSTYSLSILEDYLIRYRPKILYTVPTYHNPTGHVISEQNRRELLHLASRHRLVVIEDDPYSQLYFNETPPPSLKALDPYEGVVHLGTFSKTLMPGLRIGYVQAPEPLINKLSLEKQYDDLHSNNFTQLILNAYLNENHYETHLSMVRNIYKKRRDVLADALHNLTSNNIYFTLPRGGFYLWCKLTSKVTSSKLLHESLKNGLFFVPGEAFYSNGDGEKEFRLSFASYDTNTLIAGVEKLQQTFTKLKRRKRSKTIIDTIQKPIV